VWPASSIWISLGDTDFRVKHTESTSISPVVFGIRKSLAEEEKEQRIAAFLYNVGRLLGAEEGLFEPLFGGNRT
jgi:hypothetical protein